ncbi:bacterioferritin-associated ferredoxin [Novosphingobium sp. CCH12-A3]|uniref:(2Fe-2S)-binding protein n=1 Tax=Novosphingobium sp. CCH12-A3 TaxID=1768752 RepID=UPI00078579A7|nr:(2Fe-2S)-binding protein [Novosphingobium sp. CCH12-A3]
MIVCSCNFIREQQIREAARGGVMDVVDVYEALGCTPNCYQCLPFAERIIEDEVCAAA